MFSAINRHHARRKFFFIEIDMGQEMLETPRFSIETAAATCIGISYSEILENNISEMENR